VRTGWGLTGLLAAFPVTMFGANFGIGAPLIIALHLAPGEFSSTIVWAATFLVMGLCALAVRGASLFLPEPARRPAEAPGGLNIEGLAATPGGGVLVGFRNPLHQGRALIVPLENPAQMIEGERARLGAPIELDLGGRGIRSMELVGSSYVIVAGPTADEGTFALYRWSGKPEDAATPVRADLRDLRPEGLFAIPGTSSVQLLSDDGGIEIEGVECKSLPMARQTFRAMTLTP
jgi:hypothetical protein